MKPASWIGFTDAAGALWIAALRGTGSLSAVTDLPTAALPQRPQGAVILRSGRRLSDVQLLAGATGAVEVAVAEPVAGDQWLGARLEVTAGR